MIRFGFPEDSLRVPFGFPSLSELIFAWFHANSYYCQLAKKRAEQLSARSGDSKERSLSRSRKTGSNRVRKRTNKFGDCFFCCLMRLCFLGVLIIPKRLTSIPIHIAIRFEDFRNFQKKTWNLDPRTPYLSPTYHKQYRNLWKHPWNFIFVSENLNSVNVGRPVTHLAFGFQCFECSCFVFRFWFLSFENLKNVWNEILPKISRFPIRICKVSKLQSQQFETSNFEDSNVPNFRTIVFQIQSPQTFFVLHRFLRLFAVLSDKLTSSIISWPLVPTYYFDGRCLTLDSSCLMVQALASVAHGSASQPANQPAASQPASQLGSSQPASQSASQPV